MKRWPAYFLTACLCLWSVGASAPGLAAADGGTAATSAAETRAQFLAALCQTLDVQPAGTPAQVFPDVVPGSAEYGCIMEAHQRGWISGFPTGTFQPDSSLTREQMAKIEVLALGLQTGATRLASQRPPYSDAGSVGKWAWGYVQEATAVGLLKGFTGGAFGPTSTFTAGQANDALSQLTAYLAAHAAPVVTAVTPSSGPGAGGTRVTVTGSGFGGVTAVHFGSTAAAAFTVASGTTITATAPAGSGTVDITVTTRGGTSATTAADKFAYTAVGVRAVPVPTAITTSQSSPAMITSGSPQSVTFTVRDQYGDGMAGATVQCAVTGTLQTSDLGAASATTNSSGQATVRYTDGTAGDSGTVTCNVSGSPTVRTATGILTVANPGVQITGAETGATTDPAAPATAGGTGSTTANTSASASGGTGSVTVQTFSANPGPVTGAFTSSGTYFDVSLSSANTFNSATIQECGVAAGGLLYWLQGSTWAPVSPAASFSGGCLTFMASSSSSPSIAGLTGTPMAIAKAAPALSPAPTLSASTDAAGDTTVSSSAASGDTLTVVVSASRLTTPLLGDAAPAPGSGVTTDYAAGGDISAKAGDFLGVFAVNGSGGVVAFSQLEVAAADIAEAPTAAISTDGWVVVLSFDDPMNDPSNYAGDFTVLVNGAADYLASATLESNPNDVDLSLQSPVASGDTVTVDYAGNPDVTFASGGALGNFSRLPVANDVPGAPPQLQGAYVSPDGAQVWLQYDKDLADPGSPSEFSVTLNGDAGDAVTATAIGEDYADGRTDEVLLTLTTPITATDTATLGYDGSDVTSQDGGVAQTFQDYPVQNTLPKLGNAYTSDDGLTVHLNFNQAMGDPSPYGRDFSVTKGGANDPVTAVALDANTEVIDLTLESPVASGDMVTVSYSGTSDVQTVDGSDLAPFADAVVVNSIGAPTVETAATSTDGRTVVLGLSLAMSDPSAHASDFTVSDNGVDDPVRSAALDSDPDDIDLALQNPVVAGDLVTVSYGGYPDVRCASGGILGDFDDQPVTNDSTVVALTLQTASTSPDGTQLTLSFNEGLAGFGTSSDFAVTLDGQDDPVQDTAFGDSQDSITLTLAAPITAADAVMVSYSGVDIAAKDGAVLQAFSNQSATNILPAFVSAATSTDGGTVHVTFDQAMGNPSLYYTDFSVTDGSANDPVQAATSDSNASVVDLTLNSPVSAGDAVTVSYDGTCDVQSAQGGCLEPFSDQPVQNGVGSPTLVSAATSTDGTVIVLSFSDAMNDPSAYAGDFTVSDNGTDDTIDSATPEGDQDNIDLNLSTPLNGGDTVTVSYQGYPDVTSASGGHLVNFTDSPVVNNVPPPPPTLRMTYTANGTQVVLWYGEVMANPGSPSDFTVTRNGNEDDLVTGAGLGEDYTGSTDEVLLTLTTPVVAGDSVTVSYTGSDMEAQDGGLATMFSNAAVMNMLPAVANAYTSTDGLTVYLNFNQAMEDPSSYAQDFSVYDNGSPVTVNSAVLDSDTNMIDLSLASAVAAGDTVTVTYTGTSDVQSAEGSDLAPFSNLQVENDSEAVAP